MDEMDYQVGMVYQAEMASLGLLEWQERKESQDPKVSIRSQPFDRCPIQSSPETYFTMHYDCSCMNRAKLPSFYNISNICCLSMSFHLQFGN